MYLLSTDTLKPLNKIYDREDEKRVISGYIDMAASIAVTGLRRVGKTTLVRSLSAVRKNTYTAYFNLWRKKPSCRNFEPEILDLILDELIKSRGVVGEREYIKRLEFFGGIVKITREKREHIIERFSIADIIASNNKIILILDEFQSVSKKLRDCILRKLVGLKDTYDSYLTIIFTGSVYSLKKFIGGNEEAPFYGRLIDEILIQPLQPQTAREFLREGLRELGKDITEDALDYAIGVLGGFPGWIVNFGLKSISIRDRIDIKAAKKLIKDIEKEALLVLVGEIKRILKQVKNKEIYIKTLYELGLHGNMGPTRLASMIGRTKSEASRILNFLTMNGLVKNIDGEYIIADPLLRRVAGRKIFVKEMISIKKQ